MVIYDTEQEIREAKKRVVDLQAALIVFKERRDSKEPFPGENQSGVKNDLAQ